MLLTSRMKDQHHDRTGTRRTLGRPCVKSALVLLLLVGGVAVNARSLSVAPPALTARAAQDDGYVWCTVGDLNNVEFEGYAGRFEGQGSIPYYYKIAKSEVLTRQYLEFVEAYWPFYNGDPRSDELLGLFITGRQQGNGYVFSILPGWEEAPNTMSLRMAARFCNWLHNGKVSEQWAFEQGVYDTSTFTRNPDGSYNDDYTRSADARYWIPTSGEWLKAVYYDPNRYGPGQGGWWHQPARSETPLKLGYPPEGQTNASLWEWYTSYLPAGMYPEVQTPWGLLDASGGVTEHTVGTFAYALGSTFLDQDWTVAHFDNAGEPHTHTWRYPERGYLDGLRLAKPASPW